MKFRKSGEFQFIFDEFVPKTVVDSEKFDEWANLPFDMCKNEANSSHLEKNDAISTKSKQFLLNQSNLVIKSCLLLRQFFLAKYSSSRTIHAAHRA